MKTSAEESDHSPARPKSARKEGNVKKVLNPKSEDNKSDNKFNGINGCSDVCPEELTDNREDRRSGESANGIRLLCDAVDAIETSKCYSKCQHLNGLIVDNHCSNGQINCCSALSKSDSLPITCCCCQTSSSSSANTSCSTSSATLSCDTNKESVVQFNDDKDINNLTNRVSTQLNISELNDRIDFVNYESERQMPDIMRLIQKDLSEPYSIYTYRYFIHNWPHLCFLVSLASVGLNRAHSHALYFRRWTATNAWVLSSANSTHIKSSEEVI